MGVAFVAVQIWQRKKFTRAEHDRKKKQSTIEFYNSLLSDSYEFLDTMRGHTSSFESINSDEKVKLSVIRFLARLERLAVGVASGVYDFEILCKMTGSYLIAKYEDLKPYIDGVRESENAPKRYAQFVKLVGEIKEYREKDNDGLVGKGQQLEL